MMICLRRPHSHKCLFFFFLSNHFPLVEEAHSLLLTESSSLEGFSINQVQCFTESALRTPSWRSSWGSCPPGCLCAMKDGTRHWERWSADSWVIWGWPPLTRVAAQHHSSWFWLRPVCLPTNLQLNLHPLLFRLHLIYDLLKSHLAPSESELWQ